MKDRPRESLGRRGSGRSSDRKQSREPSHCRTPLPACEGGPKQPDAGSWEALAALPACACPEASPPPAVHAKAPRAAAQPSSRWLPQLWEGRQPEGRPQPPVRQLRCHLPGPARGESFACSEASKSPTLQCPARERRVYVYKYINIYIYIYILYLYISIYMCVCAYISVRVYIYIYTRMGIHAICAKIYFCVHTYICIRVCVCVCACVCVCLPVSSV